MFLILLFMIHDDSLQLHRRAAYFSCASCSDNLHKKKAEPKPCRVASKFHMYPSHLIFFFQNLKKKHLFNRSSTWILGSHVHLNKSSISRKKIDVFQPSRGQPQADSKKSQPVLEFLPLLRQLRTMFLLLVGLTIIWAVPMHHRHS